MWVYWIGPITGSVLAAIGTASASSTQHSTAQHSAAQNVDREPALIWWWAVVRCVSAFRITNHHREYRNIKLADVVDVQDTDEIDPDEAAHAHASVNLNDPLLRSANHPMYNTVATDPGPASASASASASAPSASASAGNATVASR
jgi:hypothetical protein